MISPNEIPSLSAYLDTKLEVEVVSGKVEGMEGRLFCTFSIASEELAGMTADELFLLYLKPLMDGLATEVNKMGPNVCTKARPLPGKGEKVVGFRCWKGKIPVNIYIARRMGPDRHQFIVELHVQTKGDDDGEA